MLEDSVDSNKSRSSVAVFDKCSVALGVPVPIPTLLVEASAVKYALPLLFSTTKYILFPPSSRTGKLTG